MIRLRPGEPRDGARGYVRRVAHIEAAVELDDVWFMTPNDIRPVSDGWLIPVATVLGMALGENVHVAGRVSGRLLASLGEIQRISALRNKRLTPVQITASEVLQRGGIGSPRALSCFSAGVDAFFTVLEQHQRIDQLLYVHGFEALVEDERVLAKVLPHVHSAADELGKPLRLAETNWRSVFEPIAGYDYFTGMPMIFSIASLMGSGFSELVVPGTHDPWSPPEDASSVASYVGHWSTDSQDVVEHGHAARLDKIRRVAESDIAMRHLRVCWDRRHPIYNCGRCVKCMRTRVHLKLARVEGRCATLPPRLSLGEIRRAEPETPVHINYIDESIAAAESEGMTDLAAALRHLRGRSAQAAAGKEAATRKAGRFAARLYRSYRKRRFDGALRRLKRQHGAEHLFTCLGGNSPELRA